MNRSITGAPYACALSLFAASSASAESAAQPIDQVTITARPSLATAPDENAARAALASVPGGASVVGREEYENGRASNLRDVFALTPGVYVQSRFGAEEARLSIRGSGLQRTFHMRGINLLQDGVPITLADGGGDFQVIEPLALAYTEVLRGANALQYGGTSLGGSINFVSPSGYDAAGLEPRLEVGSFGYRRVMTGFGATEGSLDAFVSLSAYSQEGYRDWSQQKGQRFFGNAGFRLGEGVETRFFAAAVHSDSQLPGSLTKAQLQADSRQASAANLAGRQKRDFDLYRLANRTSFDLGSGELELSAGWSYKDLWHPIFQVLQQRSNDYNAGIRYVSEQALGERANRIVAGFAPSWNRVSDDRFVNVAGEKGARTGDSAQRSRNLAVYVEDQFAVSRRLTLVAGAQWAEARRRYDDAFLANGDQSLDVTYARVSPKLGFLWKTSDSSTLYGNVSDSFEPPSFGELSGGPGVSLLQRQFARTVELGTRGGISRIDWDVAAYSAEVRNELLSLNDPNGQPLGTVNAPRTQHRGVELGAKVKLTSTLAWRSAYLWSDFHFEDNASYGNNALPGIPEHFYRGELAWTFHPHYALAATTEWSPKRYAIDMAGSWFADSYAVWGLRLSRDARHGLSWFVEGRNLADRRYAATTGVIADARGTDIAQFLPGDGRAVYAGVAWQPR